MVADSFDILLHQVASIEKQFHVLVDNGFLILCRMLGFSLVAPVFGRKDVPFPMKMGFSLIMSFVLVWLMPVEPSQTGLIHSENLIGYFLQVFINATIGAFIGLIGAMIMEAVGSAGSLMNNQIGLSSAMMFDPSTRQQVALVEKLMTFLALMVFFHIGGVYWMLSAFVRSFEIFPLHSVTPDITGEVSLDYLIRISGNCLVIGTQLMAPVMVVTMAVDMILGIVNRTAQQIQVFQLSHALKPSIGISAFLFTLPIFVKVLENYLNDYASIF